MRVWAGVEAIAMLLKGCLLPARAAPSLVERAPSMPQPWQLIEPPELKQQPLAPLRLAPATPCGPGSTRAEAARYDKLALQGAGEADHSGE